MIGSTGERCPQSGIWKCMSCGRTITLEKGSIFPLCEKCQLTTWQLVRRT